jgi:dGTPase
MLYDQEALSAREKVWLAGYATRSEGSLGRTHPEVELGSHRTAFQRDRDRVIHSSAFRRLEYKTQVFVNGEGDHYRTRLTHTLEVAQVARSLAVALGLHETLTETLALAHDLGHPPFGHGGEATLDQLMREAGEDGFEHNRQALRVVTELEQHALEYSGLNLCFETLEGIAKHEATRAEGAASLADRFRPEWRPSLEAQVANVADETAYVVHDLDDGLRSGLIRDLEVAELRLWRSVDLPEAAWSEHPAARKVRSSRLLGYLIEDLLAETEQRLRRGAITSLEQVRACQVPLVGHRSETSAELEQLRGFLGEHLYRHPRVLKQVYRAEQVLRAIFVAYAQRPVMLPKSVQQRFGAVGLARALCDYVAGMTDRFAFQEFEVLGGA